MAKNDKPIKPDDDEEEAVEPSAPTHPFIQKILDNKERLIMAAGGFVLLLALSGGATYYFLNLNSENMQSALDERREELPITPPEITFYDVPDIIVNIQSADSTPAYLKLSIAFELASFQEKAGIITLQPRIVDQFQGYLRELRVDDLKGSAGVMRMKEELLRRVNVAAAPYRVRDILLKQLIIQ